MSLTSDRQVLPPKPDSLGLWALVMLIKPSSRSFRRVYCNGLSFDTTRLGSAKVEQSSLPRTLNPRQTLCSHPSSILPDSSEWRGYLADNVRFQHAETLRLWQSCPVSQQYKDEIVTSFRLSAPRAGRCVVSTASQPAPQKPARPRQIPSCSSGRPECPLTGLPQILRPSPCISQTKPRRRKQE